MSTRIFTNEEVALHDNKNDCYMIFGDKVYAMTSYLEGHDKFLDIRSWCGKDISSDFKTKADVGRDHRTGTYEKLEDYYIGEIEEPRQPDVAVIQPYNFWLPFLLPLVVYLAWWFIAKSKLSQKSVLLSMPIFNFFWNTVMLLLLIPTVIFGFIMVFRYEVDYLNFINFDWIYWHVEFSIAFGVIATLHLINRLKLYTAPLNLLKARPVSE